jgi:hypothetical protein
VTGGILLAAGVAWTLLGRLAGVDAPFLILNWHLPAILLGLYLMYRGKRYRARSQPAELSDDTRPPVVYLRPFREDATTAARVLPGLANPAVLLTTFSTFEEQLAEAVHPIGPLVALAQPREALPKPGAARFSATDDEWKDLVTTLLDRARLVVVRPGQSDALRWEIQRAFEILRPSQLLLLFHETSRKEYDACSNALRQSLRISLPDVGGREAFIAFGDAWAPHALPLRAPYFRRSQRKPWKRLIHHALEPVFRDLGVDWRPSPVSALTISALVILVLFLVFVLSLVLTS